MSRRVIPFPSLDSLKPKGKGWKGSREIQKIQNKLTDSLKQTTTLTSKPANPNSLLLYKDFFKTIQQFPIQSYHSKLKFNVREVFNLYRDIQDEKEIEELIQEGRKDLQILKSLSSLDKVDLDLLFKKESQRLEKKE